MDFIVPLVPIVPCMPTVPFVPNLEITREQKEYKPRTLGDENNFKQLYRFTRESVDFLVDQFLPATAERRGGALSNFQKMKSFLRYVGDPGFQVGVGEDLGIHQSSVSNTNWYVCQKIVEKASDWIKFPSNAQELKEAQIIWEQKFAFPCAIGAIDCTHVLIKKPHIHGDEYINRKNLASFNVQATCDANELFTSINCKWPGSVHDARIWRNSDVRTFLNENSVGAILLGDEGYPLTPWLMTPFRDPKTPKEIAYNKCHTKERCVIERMFGQVKQRFPILQSKIRMATDRVPAMIAACFVLHNVAKFLKDSDFESEEVTTPNEGLEVPQTDAINNSVLKRGQKRREAIANYLERRL